MEGLAIFSLAEVLANINDWARVKGIKRASGDALSIIGDDAALTAAETEVEVEE